MKKILLGLIVTLVVTLAGCNTVEKEKEIVDIASDYSDVEHIDSFDGVLTQAESNYVVYYYSANCGYCNLIKDYVLEYASDNNVDIKVYFLDADNVTGTNTFNLTGTPTIMIVENGVVVQQESGYITVKNLLNTLEGGGVLPEYTDFDHVPTYASAVTQTEDYYIVYFYRTTCGYCNQIKDFMLNFAANNTAGVKMYFLDTENTTGINTYDVTGTPTILIIENGVVTDKAVGAVAVPEFLRTLE